MIVIANKMARPIGPNQSSSKKRQRNEIRIEKMRESDSSGTYMGRDLFYESFLLYE